MVLFNLFIGVGFDSEFRRTLVRLENLKTSLSNRPLSRLKRNCVCYTSGGSSSSFNDTYFEVFLEITLKLGDPEIIYRSWNTVRLGNGDNWQAILDYMKEEGANQVVQRHNFFFRNADSIAATKACLFAHLQGALLERTENTTYDITVAYWWGAWKQFLFEGTQPLPESVSNVDVVARNALRDVIECKLKNRPYTMQEYKPYVHAWLKLRDFLKRVLEILDRCDLHYQKTRADYLVTQIAKENFEALKSFDTEFCFYPAGLSTEQKHLAICCKLFGDEGFLNLCLDLHDYEGDNSGWADNYSVPNDPEFDWKYTTGFGEDPFYEWEYETQLRFAEGAEWDGTDAEYSESESAEETESDWEQESD
uniref:Uncharacterized protein n=1 Tax=Hypsela tridens TaxID=2010880 RepID=A0A1Z2QTN7_9ASTR|nr:hypothetical protein Hy_tri1Pt0328 [Hypsela tridens]ASA34834.1 hypothetical protein Hy_tri1Pt0328 [Hypsela tridens]